MAEGYGHMQSNLVEAEGYGHMQSTYFPKQLVRNIIIYQCYSRVRDIVLRANPYQQGKYTYTYRCC